MSSNPYQGRKGLTDISIRYYKPDGTLDVPICVATPTEPQLTKGVDLTEVMAVSALGEMGLADQFPKGNKPGLKLSFPSFTPVTVGMREGLLPAVATAATNTWVVLGPRLIDKLIWPAAIAGQEGFGVTASPPTAVGSTLTDMGVGAPLTMTGTFTANTPPAGTATVAIGANMALGFSADLLGKYVTLWIPNNLAGIVRLSEANPIDRCRIDLTFVTRLLKICHLTIPEAVLNPSQGDYSLGEKQDVEITYNIIAAGRCRPYEWEWLPQQRVCV